MSTEYHKIDAPFKRDEKGVMIHGAWCRPEFEYLANLDWEWTEKVDGTNIRVTVERVEDRLMLSVAGRTDNAQIPPALMKALNDTFGGAGPSIYNGPDQRHPLTDEIGKIMVERDIDVLTIYGEGYGPKINGGGKYIDAPAFVVFDIKVGGWWLTRTAVDEFCDTVGLDSVPTIGLGSLYEAIDLVRTDEERPLYVDPQTGQWVFGTKPLMSRWGDFEAEGIVAVPKIPLFNRAGSRIITKIKAKDFR